LKKSVQNILTLEAKAAHKIGLTPNFLSLIGLILAMLSAFTFAVSQRQPLWIILATILFFASGFCDVLDGVIARIYQQTSIFGGFLDSLLDRYADAAVYAGLIVAGLCSPIWGLASLVGSVMVSYSRARAEAADIKMESIGIAERAERMLILGLASIAAVFWIEALNYSIILLAILSNFTVLQRVMHVYSTLKKKSNSLEN
jgi:archaetidylinositol phosphate synthase